MAKSEKYAYVLYFYEFPKGRTKPRETSYHQSKSLNKLLHAATTNFEINCLVAGIGRANRQNYRLKLITGPDEKVKVTPLFKGNITELQEYFHKRGIQLDFRKQLATMSGLLASLKKK